MRVPRRMLPSLPWLDAALVRAQSAAAEKAPAFLEDYEIVARGG